MLKFAYSELYLELKTQRREVILIPAPEPAFSGHKVRCVEKRNPQWYVDLCEKYPANRNSPKQKKHFDTRIKRSAILRILFRLSLNKPSRSKYPPELKELAERRLEEIENSFHDAK